MPTGAVTPSSAAVNSSGFDPDVDIYGLLGASRKRTLVHPPVFGLARSEVDWSFLVR